MTATAAPADADAARLRELGYEQELARRLRIFDNVGARLRRASRRSSGSTRSCSSARSSPGRPGSGCCRSRWPGQCLLLAVYAELASEFPIAGGAYQWSRRLIGGAYGWFSGWVAICAYAVANTTIAYLGAPWALTLLGHRADARTRSWSTGMVLVVVCALAGAFGRRRARPGDQGRASPPRSSRRSGSALALLLVFREQDFSILTDTLGAEALSGGSVGAGLLAALAVGGWVFIGFDACVGASEETRDAARHVPRAIWIALLSVGALVILNAVAVDARAPRPGGGRRRRGRRPGRRPRSSTSFGSWSDEAVRGGRARRVPRLRHGRAGADRARRCTRSRATACCPASRFLRRVDRRRSPIGAIVATTVDRLPRACCSGLNSAAVGSLIAFGTAAIYVAFLLDRARRADRAPARDVDARRAACSLGRAGLVDQRRSRSPGWRSRRSTSPGRASRSRRRTRPSTRCGPRRSCSR